MTADEIGKMLRAAGEDRKSAIRECVAWVAKHAHNYKPEALAEMMAHDLLPDD